MDRTIPPSRRTGSPSWADCIWTAHSLA